MSVSPKPVDSARPKRHLTLAELAEMPLHRLVISATVEEGGQLGPVGGIGAKSAAAKVANH